MTKKKKKKKKTNKNQIIIPPAYLTCRIVILFKFVSSRSFTFLWIIVIYQRLDIKISGVKTLQDAFWKGLSINKIYDDCSICTDDYHLKFHIPHQIAPHVSSGGSEGRQLIYKDMTHKSPSLKRVDWIRMRNTVFVHSHLPFQSRLHITHTILHIYLTWIIGMTILQVIQSPK